ncbi:hypothetical protein KFK09_011714 [Dendrobium nobile]|uniref:Reverse transcriptase zinc-binding domain-containing protein n=1 Tax=Dendrobium nobile TaxID=94219 RepID=A0A8T3BDE7_DENNO|nr:hypothetical protein KFK09_011714 [Dendrobium nobile]
MGWSTLKTFSSMKRTLAFGIFCSYSVLVMAIIYLYFMNHRLVETLFWKFSLYCRLAYSEGLKTSNKLISKGLNVNGVCYLCDASQEIHKHLFYECNLSFTVLNELLPDGSFFLNELSLHSALLATTVHSFIQF